MGSKPSQKVLVVDDEEPILELLKYNLEKNLTNKESGILTTDRVHLNEAGNQLVADILMKLIVK